MMRILGQACRFKRKMRQKLECGTELNLITGVRFYLQGFINGLGALWQVFSSLELLLQSVEPALLHVQVLKQLHPTRPNLLQSTEQHKNY